MNRDEDALDRADALDMTEARELAVRPPQTHEAFALDFTPVTEDARLYACPFCGCVVWADYLSDHRAGCTPADRKGIATMTETPDSEDTALRDALMDAFRGVTLHVRKAPGGDDYWTHVADANSNHKLTMIALDVFASRFEKETP